MAYGKDPKLTGGLGRYPDAYFDNGSRRVSGDPDSHPAEKPISIMRWLMERVVKPEEIVLDPMCGSGSTLIAASESQIRSIGIDLDAAYIARARRRLAQGSLFAMEENSD
jgi:site-specific DNA-methyltransferase (adenine-specific)